ncbi:MAG: hypothetical protein QXJ72_07835 [Thermoproteota archaeon]
MSFVKKKKPRSELELGVEQFSDRFETTKSDTMWSKKIKELLKKIGLC